MISNIHGLIDIYFLNLACMRRLHPEIDATRVLIARGTQQGISRFQAGTSRFRQQIYCAASGFFQNSLRGINREDPLCNWEVYDADQEVRSAFR